jgi:hypothetical protein
VSAPPRFAVRPADWRTDAAALASVRRAVFIVEQQVPENLEWDALDVQCVHALAHDERGVPIG